MTAAPIAVTAPPPTSRPGRIRVYDLPAGHRPAITDSGTAAPPSLSALLISLIVLITLIGMAVSAGG